MDKKSSVMMFKVVGNGSVERGFILAGLNGTEGVNICEKIEGALKRGIGAIDVQAEKISFIVEGLSCMFFAEEEGLDAVKKMLTIGRVQHEPYSDSNYQGFRLTRSA